MSTMLKLQIVASLGALCSIALLYVALKQEADPLAIVALVFFGVSLMVTPALKLLRVADHKADST